MWKGTGLFHSTKYLCKECFQDKKGKQISKGFNIKMGIEIGDAILNALSYAGDQ